MLQQAAPWIGYLATVLLAISLLVSSDIKFRWLNLAGCLAFIFYGVVLKAIPVVLTNVLLLGINAWFLFRIYRRNELFEMHAFEKRGILTDRFLAFYQQDIKRYFPAFNAADLEGNLNFIVLRDLVIANMFSAKLLADGLAEVQLNYTVGKYRDYKVGRFIFEKEKQLLVSKGIRTLFYKEVANRSHQQFLDRMGFKKEMINGTECLVKHLDR